jgi:hypothetical protein
MAHQWLVPNQARILKIQGFALLFSYQVRCRGNQGRVTKMGDDQIFVIFLTLFFAASSGKKWQVLNSSLSEEVPKKGSISI